MKERLPPKSHFIKPKRKKFTTTVDPKILKKFREKYTGSIGNLLDGVMLTFLHADPESVNP